MHDFFFTSDVLQYGRNERSETLRAECDSQRVRALSQVHDVLDKFIHIFIPTSE